MGTALFLGFSLQIIGLQYTTPSKNAFLTATNVVIVPFIAFLICRKKVGLKGIAGAVLAIAGVGGFCPWIRTYPWAWGTG